MTATQTATEGYPTELVAALYNAPLLLERSSADALFATLSNASRGGDVSPEAFGFYFYDRDRGDDFKRVDGIAIIDIEGGLFKWRLARIRRQIERARTEGGVRAILLNVDSPGGTVQDTFDITDLIYETRSRMPVYAIANDTAYSAGYALASAAERLSLPRSGGVGSVGVIATHVEFSEADRRAGIKFTTLTSGERKADLIDTEPLNDTARDNLQAELDRLRMIFVNTVARNRGLSADEVFATEAGIFHADDALAHGFADAVETYAETLEALRARLKPATGRVGATSGGSTMTEAEKRYIEALNQQNIAEAEARGREAALASAKTPTTTTTDAGGETVSIDAARSSADQAAVAARQAERESTDAYMSEVDDICRLAGVPERAVEFIKSRVSVEDVRKELLTAAASRDAATQVSGQHGGGTGAETPKIDSAEIYSRRAEQSQMSASEKNSWARASQ